MQCKSFMQLVIDTEYIQILEIGLIAIISF